MTDVPAKPVTPGGLSKLIHGAGGTLPDFPQPFERDIFLFDTHVAGTSHIANIKEMAPKLTEGARLDFFREPDNKYDSRAIVIKTASGEKTGYVPQADNAVFARLMDAGKLLFGRVTKTTEQGGWVKIDIKVYLHE